MADVRWMMADVRWMRYEKNRKKFVCLMKDRYLCTRDTNHKSIIMPQTTLNKIEFIAMVVALFAKKHRYSEPVAYQYISKYGGAKLLIDHYGFLHTQDYDQVVEDLDEFCYRQGGTI